MSGDHPSRISYVVSGAGADVVDEHVPNYRHARFLDSLHNGFVIVQLSKTHMVITYYAVEVGREGVASPVIVFSTRVEKPELETVI